MRRVLVVLILALGSLSSPLAAQGKGSPIFKHSATKAQIVAGVKSGCPQSLFNVTCNEFLGMLQASDPEYAPLAVVGLPAYLETLTEGLCGEEKATLAGIFLKPTRAVLFNEHRNFNSGERCLRTTKVWPEPARNVMSTDCGNGNVYRAQEMSLSVQNPFKDSLSSLRDSIRAIKDKKQHIKIGASGYVSLDWAGMRDTIHQSRSVDTLGVVLDLTISPRVVLEMASVKSPKAVHDTVSKSCFLQSAGAFLVGGGIGYFLHQDQDNDNTTIGGPVNPKNQVKRSSGPSIRFSVQIKGFVVR